MKLIGKQKQPNFGVIQKKLFFIDYNDSKVIDRLQKKIKENLIPSMTRRTNVKGEMTSWNCFVDDKDFLKVMKFINPYLFKFICDYKKQTDRVNLIDAWGNKLLKNDYIQKHDHLVCGWNGLSGNMYFSDKEPGTYFVSLKGGIKPKKGRIVIFDSSELHLVDVVKDKEPRYTLAFNMKYE